MSKESVHKSEFHITAEKFAADLDLEIVYAPEGELCFRSTATNRPGLLFAGFDEYFPEHRIQILGNAEMAYLDSLDEEKRDMQLERLFSRACPASSSLTSTASRTEWRGWRRNTARRSSSAWSPPRQ